MNWDTLVRTNQTGHSELSPPALLDQFGFFAKRPPPDPAGLFSVAPVLCALVVAAVGIVLASEVAASRNGMASEKCPVWQLIRSRLRGWGPLLTSALFLLGILLGTYSNYLALIFASQEPPQRLFANWSDLHALLASRRCRLVHLASQESFLQLKDKVLEGRGRRLCFHVRDCPPGRGQRIRRLLPAPHPTSHLCPRGCIR